MLRLQQKNKYYIIKNEVTFCNDFSYLPHHSTHNPSPSSEWRLSDNKQDTLGRSVDQCKLSDAILTHLILLISHRRGTSEIPRASKCEKLPWSDFLNPRPPEILWKGIIYFKHKKKCLILLALSLSLSPSARPSFLSLSLS